MSLWNSSVFILLPPQKIAWIFILAACKGICQYFGEFYIRYFETLRTVTILWGLWCLRPPDPQIISFGADGRQIGAVRPVPQLSMNSRPRLSANTPQQCLPCSPALFSSPGPCRRRGGTIFGDYSVISHRFLPSFVCRTGRWFLTEASLSRVMFYFAETQLAHRQPHREPRGCAPICLVVLTKRKHIEEKKGK